MDVHFSTRRQDLTAMIEMAEEGLAYQMQEDGTQDAKMVEVVAQWKAELASLGGADHSSPYTQTRVENPLSLTDRPAAGGRAANQFGTFKVHHASPAQTRFIKSLMDQRDLSSLADSVVIDVTRLRMQVETGTVNKKAASAIIDRLLACPEIARPATTPGAPAKVTRPASDKQTGLIGRLAAERDYGQNATIATVLAGQPVESRDASAAIDHLFASPKHVVKVAAAPLEAGMYRLADGTLVRVYYGRQSGQMLVKRVVEVSDGEYDFEYMGKADRFVTANQRMSLAEAKEWGRITGTCCVCTAHLDDPTSVAAGIGPICAKKNF